MHDVKRNKQNSRPVKTVTESPLSSFAAGVFWGLHCMLSLSLSLSWRCIALHAPMWQSHGIYARELDNEVVVVDW